MKFRLELTCGACPEQYDVYDRDTGEKVAYLRLRHGHFRAEWPYDDGNIVYEADTKGDGVFEDDERPIHIGKALIAVREAINNTIAKNEYEAALDGDGWSFDKAWGLGTDDENHE